LWWVHHVLITTLQDVTGYVNCWCLAWMVYVCLVHVLEHNWFGSSHGSKSLPSNASAAASDIVSVGAHKHVITIYSWSDLTLSQHAVAALFCTAACWFHAAS
jgi:uncharacterized membrane protein